MLANFDRQLANFDLHWPIFARHLPTLAKVDQHLTTELGRSLRKFSGAHSAKKSANLWPTSANILPTSSSSKWAISKRWPTLNNDGQHLAQIGHIWPNLGRNSSPGAIARRHLCPPQQQYQQFCDHGNGLNRWDAGGAGYLDERGGRVHGRPAGCRVCARLSVLRTFRSVCARRPPLDRARSCR